ncbi:hypothetical protein GCM10020000_11920 [Streptomyces olivoverticillatus]
MHFAAESHVDRSITAAADFVRTNVGGTQTLLEACLRTGTGRVVHVSTDEVYGSIEQGSWTEEWPLEPNTPYAASKAASDLVARAYGKTHGLDVSITRCSNNYGPHQHPEKLIPLFVTNLLEGRQVPLYGDGRNIREWLHVDDHCRAIHLVLTGGPRGGGLQHRWRKRAHQPRHHPRPAGPVGRGSGHDPARPRPQGARPALLHRRDQDPRRAGLRPPHTPFEQGLADTVAWYRDNPGWWKAVRTSKETPCAS